MGLSYQIASAPSSFQFGARLIHRWAHRLDWSSRVRHTNCTIDETMKRILIQPTNKILSFILPFAFLTACTTAVVNTTASTVVSLASTTPAPTPLPAQLSAEKQTATSVPPTLAPDRPSASLTAQPSAMPAPQVIDIRWDTSPTARIIRYYTGPGALAYNIDFYIPEAQVSGNGRIIWTQGSFHTPRQVLVGDLTPDQMKALLQHIAISQYDQSRGAWLEVEKFK